MRASQQENGGKTDGTKAWNIYAKTARLLNEWYENDTMEKHQAWF